MNEEVSLPHPSRTLGGCQPSDILPASTTSACHPAQDRVHRNGLHRSPGMQRAHIDGMGSDVGMVGSRAQHGEDGVHQGSFA